MSEQDRSRVLMDEGGIKITLRRVTTPDGEFAIKDIRSVSRKVHKPLWGPFLLASLGTLTMVAATQTMFWGDWLACGVMLGGGLYWRTAGTRHVLVLETQSKKIDAWYARTAEQCNRALEIIRRAVG